MADLKGMSRKEKIEYIWDYYKLHIIGAIAVIFFIGSFIHGMVTRIDYVANVTLIGSSISQTKVTEFEKQLTSMVVKEGEKRKQAIVEFTPTDKSEMSFEFMQKFMAKVSAGEIGIVVLDKGFYDTFIKQGMFLRLDNINNINLSNIKYSKIEGNTQEQGSGIYAISAEGNKALEDLGYDTKNKMIGIIASSSQKNNDFKIFSWLSAK